MKTSTSTVLSLFGIFGPVVTLAQTSFSPNAADTEDTYIAEAFPTSNFGSATEATVDDDEGGSPAHGLLKFGAVTVPTGQMLATAKLRLLTTNPTPGTITARRMIDSWTEGSATWNSLSFGNPSTVSSTSFSFTNPTSGAWLEFDVKSDVEAWIGGAPNQGWIFSSSFWDGWDFATSESSNAPQLLLTSVPIPTENTETFSIAVDTMIWKANPNTAYGSLQDITVDLDDAGQPTQALIKFDDLSLPQGATAVSAELEVYANNPTSGTISGYRMNQGWSESSTWNDFGSNGINPGSEAASSASFTIPNPSSGNEFKTIDVTSDVTAWISGTANNGWVLITNSGNGWDFDSAETNRGPKLTVSYTTSGTPTTPPPAPVAAPTPAPVVSPITLEFSAIDTMIWQLNPNTAYGTLQDITVDQDDGGQPTQGLIKFEELQLNIGQSSTVISADLHLYSNNPTSGTVSGYRMISSWSSSSTWNDFSSNGINPGSEAVSSASFTIPDAASANVWKVVDVTGDVTDWVSGAASNNGWVLINSSTNGFDFDSSETTHKPKLVVTFNSEGGNPTPTPPTLNPPTPTPPTGVMCPNGPASYHPGDLTVTLSGGLATGSLLASSGLNGRVLTREGQSVNYDAGGSSSASMHGNADGAATVPDDNNANRYFLISNSETSSGGVGILHFDTSTSPHSVIDYYRTATNTQTGSRNCGGGRTPWGTWLTSEESGTGSVYEVDPNEGGAFCRSPIVPSAGGNYESNAYWESTSDNKYHFFTTNDASSNYRLTRFIPDDTKDTMLAKPRKLDRLCGASGQLTYLRLICTSGCGGDRPSGTYSWSTSRSPTSGDQAYPSAEGIDVKNDDLYFVTKGQRRLYIVDLSGNTWRSGETIQSDSGSEFSPDQVARITGSNSPDDILYFCEDGSGNQDIHARGLDANGVYRFFTIIRGYTSSETTGLTFSPDNKYMYFAHQGNSEIWQIWREDGCSFGDGNYLDVNYHSFDPFRNLRGANKIPEIEVGDGRAVFEP